MTQRDTAAVRILCAPEDETRAREILDAWPADHALPDGLGIRNEGDWRRLTATRGRYHGWLPLSNSQWETLASMGGPAEHLARVLARYAAGGGMTPRERLLAIAPLLWGERWQTEMVKELRVNRRTLSRYVNTPGKVIPPALLDRLTAAALDRLDTLADALDLPEARRAGLAIELDHAREHLMIPRKGPADAE